MKWIGIAAALLSFAGGVYSLLQTEGELRGRTRVVKEQMAAGHLEQTAGDYQSAWESFAKAATTAQVDGLFAKLLGGLSSQQQEIRVAQEDLAMLWLRESHATEGQSFTEIANKLVDVLTVASTTANGPRKADALAHLGWAQFLKSRSGELNAQPEKLYQEAVAADGVNPYANVFWGHWILWNRGPLAEAERRFGIALSAAREHATVRRFQLAALENAGSVAESAWLRVVNEMHKANEPLYDSTLHHLFGCYYFALNNEEQRRQLFTAVSPAEHLELEGRLLAAGREDQRLTLNAMMALTYEEMGQTDAAVALWRAIKQQLAGQESSLGTRAEAAIERLSR